MQKTNPRKNTAGDRSVDYEEIINIIGEDRIEKLHFTIGSKALPVAAIQMEIKRRRILQCINEGLPVYQVAKQTGVSRMTVYRHIRNMLSAGDTRQG